MVFMYCRIGQPFILPDAAHHRRELSRLLLISEAKEDRFYVKMENDGAATEARRLYGALDEELLQAFIVGSQEADQHALRRKQKVQKMSTLYVSG